MEGMLINSYIEDIARRIHDPLLHGATSVMVGAGFSKNAEAVDEGVTAPNWEELAKYMYESLYKQPKDKSAKEYWELQKIKKTSGKNVLKLAEEYKVVFGRNKLNRFIEANINDDKYLPGDLHKRLLELNWRDVFTTNYDTLLERTIDKINVKYNYKILTNQNDLPGSTHPRIIKLHGSVDSVKHYIICEEDYRTYPIQYAPFVNTVQQAMLETQLCLIGFSGDDPNFLSWLGWLRDNMGDNCPPIYMVGLFYEMSKAERMMLESQNITILDLGDLFEETVGHQEALEKFFSMLSEYGLEKKEIYKKIPYKNISLRTEFNISIDDDYFEQMNDYLSKLKNESAGYLAFPNTPEVKRLKMDLNEHFIELLKLNPNGRQIKLLGKIIYFLRRMYLILEDRQAESLSRLISLMDENELNDEKVLQGAWGEIALYLLEMYRIDGRNEEYKQLLSDVEILFLNLDGYINEELQIEKCKYLISTFDYINAVAEVEKINETISLDIQLKKVFLYALIGEKEKGKDLLRRASAILAQKRYAENKMASLKGYLNLCASALFLSDSDGNFSDREYVLNKYNSRNIYNEIKNDVSAALLLALQEGSKEKPGFNPGTYRLTYGTMTKKEQDAISEPMKYVTFQDLLCLPNNYSDHKDILSVSLKEIIQTSPVPTWKWSSIIRMNDSKIINSFFTRELIISSNVQWVECLFDQLFQLIEQYKPIDSFRNTARIITQETAIDVLSRFSIVLDDERIIRFISKIIEVSTTLDEFDSRLLMEAFGRVSFTLNANILSNYFYKIIASDSIPIYFLYEFIDIRAISDRFTIDDDLMESVIREINSIDQKVRDRGIAKAILIEKFSEFGKFKSQVGKAIWEQRNPFGFPNANNISVTTWLSLPYPENLNLESQYMKYLENPQFIRSVNGGSIVGISNIDYPINTYIQFFRRVSDFNRRDELPFKVIWKSEYFFNTLRYVYEYLINEVMILERKFDIFGSVQGGEKRFIKLGDFAAILATQSYNSEASSSDVIGLINDIKKLLMKNGLSTLSLDILDKVLTDDFSENDIQNVMNIMINGSREELGQALTTLDILLMFEINSVKDIEVSKHLLDLMSSLKYSDLTRIKMIVSQLGSVINTSLFLDSPFTDKITKSFEECLNKLDLTFNKSDRLLIDTNYTLSILVRNYYDALVLNKKSVPEELNAVINKLRKIKLKEVKNMWEDYHK